MHYKLQFNNESTNSLSNSYPKGSPLQMKKDGLTLKQIKANFAQEFHRTIYDSTIYYQVKQKDETGTVMDIEKPPKPSVYDEREERGLVRYAMKNPEMSIRSFTDDPIANPKEACKSTISNILLTAVLQKLPSCIATCYSKKFGKAKLQKIKTLYSYLQKCNKLCKTKSLLISNEYLLVITSETESCSKFKLKRGDKYYLK